MLRTTKAKARKIYRTDLKWNTREEGNVQEKKPFDTPLPIL